MGRVEQVWDGEGDRWADRGTGGQVGRWGQVGGTMGGQGTGGQVGRWGGRWRGGDRWVEQWVDRGTGTDRGTGGGDRWGPGGVGTIIYLMSHPSLPVERPYQLHSVQPP